MVEIGMAATGTGTRLCQGDGRRPREHQQRGQHNCGETLLAGPRRASVGKHGTVIDGPWGVDEPGDPPLAKRFTQSDSQIGGSKTLRRPSVS
jgi:hypothetical protein